MLNFNSLSKRLRHFQVFTGFNPQGYLDLVESVRIEWERLRSRKKKQTNRQRIVGGGRQLKIKTLEDRILVFLIYAKFYPSYLLLEYLFNVDEATICRIVQEMSALLSERIVVDKNRKKINSMKELIEVCPEIIEFIVDATEQKVNIKDNRYYSGKKKQKTLKTQIVIDKRGLILSVSNFSPGRCHDYDVFKKSFIPEIITRNKKLASLLADLGYQGVYKDYPHLHSRIPIKRIGQRKELNLLEKEENKKIAQKRIVVEHAFCRLKKNMILSNPYRNSLDNYTNIFKSLSYLANFRMLLKS